MSGAGLYGSQESSGTTLLQVATNAAYHPEMKMRKTVLELDLVAYSDIARVLEESMGPETVASLNDQIQAFIDKALIAIGLTRAMTVMVSTGDGAILGFDSANNAHNFTKALYDAARVHNETLRLPSSKRWFRVGGTTGDIVMRRRESGVFDIAGVKIADAVRLETAAAPGELLIDIATYEALDQSLRAYYGAQEQIEGKRDERIDARRCLFVPVPQEDLGWAVQRRPRRSFDFGPLLKGVRHDIVQLFERLYPEEKLEQLIFLLEMPLDVQPSRNLPLASRRVEVLRWAASPVGPGVHVLEAELRFLLDAN
jgi:class 3 adenylate cyclase